MPFYDPENFSDPAQIAYEQQHRILQPIWEFLKDGREDALRSPMFPPVLAIVFYFICTSIFTLMDLYGSNWDWLKKYKIQKDKKVTWPMIWNAILLQFWNHLLWIMPLAYVQVIWVPPTPLPPVAPTLFQFVWHQVVWFFLFDFEYWAFHVAEHKIRWLYRWCHSVHHQYHSPFAMMTEYLHPFELFSVGLGITITPWFFQPHIMTYWSWFIVSTWVSIEVHCGYDFPWAAHNWLEFIYGGAPKHDMHHLRPLSNYEPWMGYLDKLWGYDMSVEDLEKLKAKKTENVGLYEDGVEDGIKMWN